MVDLDRDEWKIDIHHIFPKKWCLEQHIPPKVFNAIVNKTAISYKANRMIGGKAPSDYLAQIQKHAQVKLDDAPMDDILRTHLIRPELLRADDFEKFYSARKTALLTIVAQAMGKAVAQFSEAVADDAEDDEEEETEAVA